MSTWLVEVSLQVIGQEFTHFYEVDYGGVVGIRNVNNRYEIVFDNGRVISIPANQAIVVYKEVGKEEYIANMKTLYHPRNVDLTF